MTVNTLLKIFFLNFIIAISLTSQLWGQNFFDIKSSYPKKSSLIKGSKVYPEFVLDMSDISGWKWYGSTKGHLLKATAVDLPDRPGKRGVCLYSRLDKKSPKSPTWVCWQYNLSPKLSIVGAKTVEIDIYPLQKIEFPISSRFGSSHGFGILPCTWSDIIQEAPARKWTTVKIPIHHTRKSIDNLKFDINSKRPSVPHLQERSVIIGDIRFVPAPTPATSLFSCKMNVKKPVIAGYFQNTGKHEFIENGKLSMLVELSTSQQLNNAELCIETNSTVLNKKVTLKAPFSRFELEITDPLKVFGIGKNELTITIKDPKGSLVAKTSKPLTIYCFSKKHVTSELQKLSNQHSEQQSRWETCVASGKQAELPRITLNVAKLFIKNFIPDDFNRQKQYKIAMDELTMVKSMLDNLDYELKQYGAGKIEEAPVPTYNPDIPILLKHGTITQDNKPALFIGPMTSIFTYDWANYASKTGFNSLVAETSMHHWLYFNQFKSNQFKATTGLLKNRTSQNGITNALNKYFEACRKNKLASNLLLSSHYCKKIPDKYKNAQSSTCGNGNFNWNVLAPTAKEIFLRMYGEIIPYLKKRPELISLGTANEPGYSVSSDSTDFQKAFHVWLHKKHKNIKIINYAWNSKYPSIESIDLKSFFVLRKTSSGAMVDWAEFQSSGVSRFYGFLKDTLLEAVPNKIVWVKLMGVFGYGMLDEEDNIALGQNSCGTDDGHPLWLDHLTSMYPERPITNQEWHFIRAQYVNNAAFLAKQMYQGVLRGIQSANIWRGQRADWNSKGHGHVESFSRYPLGFNAIGRTSLKLRMLYPVIVNFQKLKGGTTRLCYDKKANLIEGKKYTEKLEHLYNIIRSNPEGVRLVYPPHLKKEQLNNVKLLAAPSFKYMRQKSAWLIQKWVKRGGTLWIAEPVNNPVNYYGKKLRLDKTFVNMLKNIGIRQYGSGKVIIANNWSGYSQLFNGITAWSNSKINNDVECRILNDQNGKIKYLSIVNLKDKIQYIKLQEKQHPVSVSGNDIWNNQRIENISKMTLEQFEVKLIKVSLLN